MQNSVQYKQNIGTYTTDKTIVWEFSKQVKAAQKVFVSATALKKKPQKSIESIQIDNLIPCPLQ